MNYAKKKSSHVEESEMKNGKVLLGEMLEVHKEYFSQFKEYFATRNECL